MRCFFRCFKLICTARVIDCLHRPQWRHQQILHSTVLYRTVRFPLEWWALGLGFFCPHWTPMMDSIYPILTWIMDSFSCSPLNILSKLEKLEKSWLSLVGTWWRHFNITMTMTSRIKVRPACARRAAILFYRSLGLAWVCEKNRINHGTEKSHPEGPLFHWETRLAEFPHWTVDPRVGIFLEPLNTNDRFFFSYTTTIRYSTVSYLLWHHWGRCLQSMTHAVQINFKQRINSALNNEQMVTSSKWIHKN